jgi:hypothetical protein
LSIQQNKINEMNLYLFCEMYKSFFWVWEIGQNHYFVQFCSTNSTIEQNWLHLFLENGVRFDFSLQKSIERKNSLKKSILVGLRKLKCKIFSILKKKLFYKNSKFSKFSQNSSFYLKDLHSKKVATYSTNNHPKNLVGFWDPMVPTSGELANIDPICTVQYI